MPWRWAFFHSRAADPRCYDGLAMPRRHGLEPAVDWIKENWIPVVVVVAIAFVLWSTMGKKNKPVGEGININVKCPKCGWMGIVSKYAKACRKCANKDTKEL